MDVKTDLKMFGCAFCGKRYVWRCGLLQHQKFECGKEPQFVCNLWGCTFRTHLKGNLKRHIKNKHKILDVIIS